MKHNIKKLKKMEIAAIKKITAKKEEARKAEAELKSIQQELAYLLYGVEKDDFDSWKITRYAESRKKACVECGERFLDRLRDIFGRCPRCSSPFTR